MRRLNFSLLLLSFFMLMLTSCGVIESRISHALRGDINSVAHTEKSIKENPKEIIINWKNHKRLTHYSNKKNRDANLPKAKQTLC